MRRSMTWIDKGASDDDDWSDGDRETHDHPVPLEPIGRWAMSSCEWDRAAWTPRHENIIVEGVNEYSKPVTSHKDA